MSGRGGGRGRGRGGGRGFGGPRVLPFQAIETFPYNPNCEQRPALSKEERKLIVFNRVLKRYIDESEYNVGGGTSQKIVNAYSDRFEVDLRDPEVQKQVIVDSIGPEYFPGELLTSKFSRGRLQQVLGSSKKPTNWKDLETRERSTHGGEGGPNDDDEEDPEDDEFGGEDYAHDHYGDEDQEDDFVDDGGGGGDD